MEILENPDLFNLIDKEFDKTIVGENKSRRAIFLSRCAIWVKDIQMNILVTAPSSTGKDYTCSKVLDIFPKNKTIKRTRISPQAFTYWHRSDKEPDWSWDGLNCYLEDISDNVLNSPVFKVMASGGSIATIVINGKAVDLTIKGKPNFIVTTAEGDPKNEILNRFILISLDDSDEQTKKIMEFISKEAEDGEIEIYDEKIKEALEKLQVVEVIVPFASKMVKYFPRCIKLRRIYTNFMNLIKCSSSLHQYQREKDEKGRIIATKEDYEIAREVIEYMRNQTIKGITATEQKYYDKFREFIKSDKFKKIKKEDLYFSYTEVHTETNYKSKVIWWTMLQKLEEKGLVTSKSDCSNENSFKSVTKYTIKEVDKEDKLELPEFNKLIK